MPADFLRKLIDDPKETVTGTANELYGNAQPGIAAIGGLLAPQPGAPTSDAAPVSPPVLAPDSVLSGPTLDQQMSAYQAEKGQNQLGDMAMTGIAAGLGTGILAHLASSWRDKLKARGKTRQLNPNAQVAIPFASKMAVENPITDGMTNDPMHGVKLVGALGLPILGTYLATRGVGNFLKKRRQKDDADVIQNDYQKALNDYSATAAGLKLAGEKTALDRLAEVKTASPGFFNGFGLLGQGNPIGDTAMTALNIGVPLAALYGGYRLHQGWKKRKKEVDEAKGVQDQAVSDWRRKQLFYSPPPIHAIPSPLPVQG